jgi:hypothetical protein
MVKSLSLDLEERVFEGGSMLHCRITMYLINHGSKDAQETPPRAVITNNACVFVLYRIVFPFQASFGMYTIRHNGMMCVSGIQKVCKQ